MKVPYLQEFTRDPTPEEKELVNEIIRELPIGFDYEIHPGENLEIRRMPKGNWEPRGICGRIRIFAVHDGYRALVKDTGCCNCESCSDCVINAKPCCNCAEGWTWAAIVCCISLFTGKSAHTLSKSAVSSYLPHTYSTDVVFHVDFGMSSLVKVKIYYLLGWDSD
jgi:hypothetical protein